MYNKTLRFPFICQLKKTKGHGRMWVGWESIWIWKDMDGQNQFGKSIFVSANKRKICLSDWGWFILDFDFFGDATELLDFLSSKISSYRIHLVVNDF